MQSFSVTLREVLGSVKLDADEHDVGELGQTGLALGLHTTTDTLGLAICNLQGQGQQQTWAVGRSLASVLHQHLLEFVSLQPKWHPEQWSNLKLIAVAGGPGSFTGIRIGVTVARTLGQQLGIPVYSVSSLAILAWLHSSLHRELFCADPRLFAVQMAAKQGEVFGGLYQFVPGIPGTVEPPKLLIHQPEQLWQLEDWEQNLTQWPQAERVNAESHEPAPVLSLLDLALCLWQHGERPSWVQALPHYGRRPAITLVG
ncbi:tRNA (adenosine(37)-N6)-threonylcarbamoyltransferase complex dimerization subunit type 1 TsaB [Leptolyngbya sp. FACHB-261]|uniref:tRNA (adenosine(37)-N6)-threonylcarbamoyltransferase complex dimerization subunit type 1 TsaB n=1 Tax=Leptolyngbya sp. FACHB-261 TaxID=2692806 RepID=UPI001681CEDB|nr:tRNA (adenosine(37)-N6)-threonylcarbamoyltransferase complex dimerization subunit type 1 TsaB [Leptolyngbya sp. FACHB-261]MBD2100742.1 tRNA (adenosine(37)-N6)-threonylcarbamoyltransferase complex dimerization subunit type 1 TsaB [Leptolyngbya sp. FACHB-261]